MTTIAWDGKVLAADRQQTSGDMRTKATKIFRLDNKTVVAICGTLSCGLLLVEWYKAGAKAEAWPTFQQDDLWSRLIVATPKGIVEYEQLPVPLPILEPFMAFGSGRAYALGAMAAGCGAREAVKIASKFDTFTGLGVDAIGVKG